MKAFALLVLFLATVPAQAGSSCANSPLTKSKQLVLVITADWNSKDAHIARFAGGTAKGWTGVDTSPRSCMVGKNGMGWGLGRQNNSATVAPGSPEKVEGDGRAPAGVFPLGDAFGYNAAAEVGFPANGAHAKYHRVDGNSKCIDDPASKFYNLDVYDESKVTQDWYLKSKDTPEDLHRKDDFYEYALNVGHNGLTDAANARAPGQQKPVPGKGSCIFMHTWKPTVINAAGVEERPGTTGCTAMAKDEIRQLVTWVRPADEPVLVQLPASEYLRLKSKWCLPDVDLAKWTAPPASSVRPAPGTTTGQGSLTPAN